MTTGRYSFGWLSAYHLAPARPDAPLDFDADTPSLDDEDARRDGHRHVFGALGVPEREVGAAAAGHAVIAESHDLRGMRGHRVEQGAQVVDGSHVSGHGGEKRQVSEIRGADGRERI